jgi:hypothetical protein
MSMRKPGLKAVTVEGVRPISGRGANGVSEYLLLPLVYNARRLTWNVVDGHAPLGLLESDVGLLRHPVVAAVARPEVEHRRPVVGEVVGKRARRAGCLRRRRRERVHGCVEGVL